MQPPAISHNLKTIGAIVFKNIAPGIVWIVRGSYSFCFGFCIDSCRKMTIVNNFNIANFNNPTISKLGNAPAK